MSEDEELQDEELKEKVLLGFEAVPRVMVVGPALAATPHFGVTLRSLVVGAVDVVVILGLFFL